MFYFMEICWNILAIAKTYLSIILLQDWHIFDEVQVLFRTSPNVTGFVCQTLQHQQIEQKKVDPFMNLQNITAYSINIIISVMSHFCFEIGFGFDCSSNFTAYLFLLD